MATKTEYQGIRAETQRMLAGGEDYEVEYKESHRLVEQDVMVAFANANGGTILAGVKEKVDPETRKKFGVVIGCDISERAQLAIQDRAANCSPPLEIKIIVENMAHKPILRIDVQEAKNKPCCTGSGKYVIEGCASN